MIVHRCTTSPFRHHRLAGWSPAATGLAVVAATLGLVTGFVAFLGRDPVRAEHASGTSAWTVHLVVTVVGVFWVASAVHASRSGVARWYAPPNPFGRKTVRSWWSLVGIRRSRWARLWRFFAAVFLYAFVYYLVWRCGLQVTIGMDPNQTANAWGGPGYWGALYCHVLDAALLVAAASVLISSGPGADRTESRSTAADR